MKYKLSWISLLLVLVIIALVLTAAGQALGDRENATLIPWLPPKLTREPSPPASTPGWWEALPTPLPLPSPTERK